MSPFGDWAIEKALFLHLKRILPYGKTILELGSGEGTVELLKHWKVISIEHDLKWVGKYHDNYIYAPLKKHKEVAHHEGDMWYDARVLEVHLPKIDYDLLLVDGPPGPRGGLVKYWNLFKQDVPVVFDDLQLKRNWQVIRSISNRKGKPYTVWNAWNDGKDFGVIE